MNKKPFLHPTSVIENHVSIGKGTSIWCFSHILQHSKIGENCTIGQNVAIGPHVTIGNSCKIQNNVSVYQGITLEDQVFCGPSVVFTNVYNPRAHISRMHELMPIVVKQGATLGANSTIICGVTIGRFSFVGAGSVVTKNVPDHAFVYGNPAKQHGWICQCGAKLPLNLHCTQCPNAYFHIEEQGLVPLQ